MTDTRNDVAPNLEFRFEPALDGLRTLAVAAVVVYHEAPYLAGRGGFIGVDIFFALSGFLITSLLLSERARNHKIDLKRFWTRRARRLLPALGVAISLLALLALRSPFFRAGAIRDDTIWSVLYFQNWRNAFPGRFGSLSVLAHTWSLSVEEQWYFVWPLVLAAALRWTRIRPQRLAFACGVCAIASSLWMAHLYTASDTSRAYYGTDTRAQALLIGATFALATFHRRKGSQPILNPHLEVAAWIGLAYIAAMVTFARQADWFTFHGGFFLVGISTGFIVLAAMDSDGPMRRMLSLRVLALVGPWTYGIYLFHPLVASFLTTIPAVHGTWTAFIVVIIISCTLAYSSYRWIEMPIRNATNLSKSAVFRTGLALSFAAALGVVLSATPRKPVTLVNDAVIARLLHRSDTARYPSNKILVLGEWRTASLSFNLQNSWQDDNISGAAFGLLGCGISDGDILFRDGALPPAPGCNTWPDAFRQAVAAYKPNVIALMVGEDEIFARLVGNHAAFVGGREWRTAISEHVARIQAMANGAGANLVIVTNECVPQAAPLAVLRPYTSDPSLYQRAGQTLRAEAHRRGLAAHDFTPTLCPGNKPVRDATGNFQFDGPNGFTRQGASLFWKWFAPRMQK